MRYVVRYHGHVQGVGFRATCTMLASDLDVHGFVKNQPDGSVLLDVDGAQGDLKQLLRRIEAELDNRIESFTIDELPSLGRSGGLKIAY